MGKTHPSTWTKVQNKHKMQERYNQVLATALLAQWLNMVVLVVQSYQKVPALHALAPTGGEPIVLATQALLLVAIGYTGWRTVLRAPR